MANQFQLSHYRYGPHPSRIQPWTAAATKMWLERATLILLPGGRRTDALEPVVRPIGMRVYRESRARYGGFVAEVRLPIAADVESTQAKNAE
jgi:hypothetical protein